MLAKAPRRLLRDVRLLKNSEGKTRNLHSIRQTYAVLELPRKSTDLNTLSQQIGNRALMIERHYSKLTATGRRMGWLDGGVLDSCKNYVLLYDN